MMEPPASNQVTQKLIDAGRGDRAALDELIPIVYQELRRMADRYLRQERPDHSLQPTALVHEAYLRLIDQRQVTWQNRAHFFGVAARMMRRILVDYAKTKNRDKRGGGARKIPIDEIAHLIKEGSEDLVALDEAMKRLEEIDPRKSRVVELRYFGGLSVEETARALDISTKTVMRDWNMAKAWLYQEISRE
jgi:RNA polymerase sigma factor (TIGR02999 family)